MHIATATFQTVSFRKVDETRPQSTFATLKISLPLKNSKLTAWGGLFSLNRPISIFNKRFLTS